MVKLTEVEDEHFTSEKPVPSKESLLVSDNEDEDDYTDTGTPFPLLFGARVLVRNCFYCIPRRTRHNHKKTSFPN
jgi:hypothetical protein